MSNKFTVYLSHSVSGGLEVMYAPKVSKLIESLGGEILNKHTTVGSFATSRGKYYLKKELGDSYPTTIKEKQKVVYSLDTTLVDKADLIIFIFTKPSFGVGMELERALSRISRGLEEPIIIGTCSNEVYKKLSWMVTGAFLNNPQHTFIKYKDEQNLLVKLEKVIKQQFKINH